MNISKYQAYFHDGIILDMEQIENNVQFSMLSCAVDQELFSEKLPLSEDDTLQGKLHIVGLKEVRIDGKMFEGKLDRQYDSGSILDVFVTDRSVKLVAKWTNFPPKKRFETPFLVYEIKAEKVFWEPVLDLEKSFG